MQSTPPEPHRPGSQARGGGLWILLVTAAVCVTVLVLGNAGGKPAPPPRPESTPAGVSVLLREYEATRNWGGLRQFFERVPPTENLQPMEQHDYYRLAPQTYERYGMHGKAASAYRQYLEWSAMVHAAECRSCHAPTNGHFPTSIAEMTQSAGGAQYVLHLKAEHQVAAETKKVRGLVERAGNDPGLHLTLYHLLRWGGDSARAAEQAAWLHQCDEQLTASPPPPVR